MGSIEQAMAGAAGRVGESGTPEHTMTVRYWAGARDAAGVDSEAVDVSVDATVSDVIAHAVSVHPGLERVARVATFLVDGRAAGRDVVPGPGATLEVLPPFAGG